jgi:hypothetical protein
MLAFGQKAFPTPRMAKQLANQLRKILSPYFKNTHKTLLLAFSFLANMKAIKILPPTGRDSLKRNFTSQ